MDEQDQPKPPDDDQPLRDDALAEAVRRLREQLGAPEKAGRR